MAAVALESLIAIPAFAGIVALGAHLYQRGTARSDMANEARQSAWHAALGSCQEGGAGIAQAASQSFGVGLENAVRQSNLGSHLGEADVTFHPRSATVSAVREVMRPALMGGGVSRIAHSIGIPCNTITRARQFTKELRNVYSLYNFLVSFGF